MRASIAFLLLPAPWPGLGVPVLAAPEGDGSAQVFRPVLRNR